MGEAAENLFGGIETGEDIKDRGDFLGGFEALDSDIYDFVVESAYITIADSGAKCLNTVFKSGNRTVKQQFWFTSGKTKGCKNFYINQKTLEKEFLPGYIMARHLALLAANGKELHQLTVEKRTIKLYNKDAKKELPTEVPMCVEMLGKSVSAGVIKRLVDKTRDSNTVDKNGNKIYVATGETRHENEIDKFFRTRDRMTVTEIMAKAETAEFAAKWLDRWKGKIDDRTAKNTGTVGAPGAPAQAAATGANAADSGADYGKLFG